MHKHACMACPQHLVLTAILSDASPYPRVQPQAAKPQAPQVTNAAAVLALGRGRALLACCRSDPADLCLSAFHAQPETSLPQAAAAPSAAAAAP